MKIVNNETKIWKNLKTGETREFIEQVVLYKEQYFLYNELNQNITLLITSSTGDIKADGKTFETRSTFIEKGISGTLQMNNIVSVKMGRNLLDLYEVLLEGLTA